MITKYSPPFSENLQMGNHYLQDFTFFNEITYIYQSSANIKCYKSARLLLMVGTRLEIIEIANETFAIYIVEP